MSMHDCDLYIDLMPLVRDGAASDTSHRALEEHMAHCESCRILFAQLPDTEPVESEAEQTLARIRRRWYWSTLVLMILGTAVGIGITSFRWMTLLNMILMPLVGIAAYIALREKGWLAPVGVMAVSFLSLLARYVLVDGEPLTDGLNTAIPLAFYYGFACGFGVMVANLCGYVFAHLEGATPEKRWLERLKRAAAAVLCIALVVVPTGIIQVFVGNPVSKEAAEADAAYYVEQHYRGHDFLVGEAEYDMKRGGYRVHVQSVNSVDTNFDVYYGYFGIWSGDSYDEYVTTGMTTFWRINDAYVAAVDEALEGSQFSHNDGLTTLLRDPDRWLDVLEFDQEYDLNLWAGDYGNIYVSYNAQANETSARDLLLELRQRMDDSGILFRTVNLTIRSSGDASTYDAVPYDRITEEAIDDYLRTHPAR